ncbi:MAG: hypothetical protein O3B87_01160 [bacterium]|nr:hypothetical protein [bacterium]
MKNLNSIVYGFIIVVLIVGGVLLFKYQDSRKTTQVRADESNSPADIPPVIMNKSMVSPDGIMTVTMDSKQYEGTIRYVVSTTNEEGETTQDIFANELLSTHILSIPFNTWSPDNAHFFLKELVGDNLNYYVFNTNGAPFAENTQYLNIQQAFAQQVEGYNIIDVTGWAAPYLLLVNTQQIDGDQKLTYWFDVSSNSFIPLGTYFN